MRTDFNRPVGHLLSNLCIAIAMPLIYGCMTKPARIPPEVEARMAPRHESPLARSNAWAELERRAGSVPHDHSIELTYNSKAHVPKLLEKYASAPAEQRAAIADAWVCIGMPLEMVRDVLINPRLAAEYHDATGDYILLKWRAWRFWFKNGLLADYSREY